jgi:hypothetical protein
VTFIATNIVGSIALTWVLGITYMLTVTLSVHTHIYVYMYTSSLEIICIYMYMYKHSSSLDMGSLEKFDPGIIYIYIGTPAKGGPASRCVG